MKILQINNVYGEHSTGKLTRQLHLGLLERGHESLVVYGRGNGMTEQGVRRLCPDWYGKLSSALRRITGLPYGGCLLSTWRLQGIIRREKPDVVHLQCINGNFVNIYRLVRWLNKHRIPTVNSLHAEFMYTANCGYAFECNRWQTGCGGCPRPKKVTKSPIFDRTAVSFERMRRAFAGFETCINCPVSYWTEERGKQSPILKGMPFQTVFNGVDTDIFHRREAVAEPPMQVIHVTACFSEQPDHIKGGRYLIELARRMPEVTFLVAGNAESIQDLPKNIRLLGVVRDQQTLAEHYRNARAMVLVSKKETFSMPCAESLCCGTPIVGFKAGAPEQISMGDYSDFVEFGDVDALEKRLRQWLSAQPERQNIAREAEKIYSVNTMIDGFLEVYKKCDWSRKK